MLIMKNHAVLEKREMETMTLLMLNKYNVYCNLLQQFSVLAWWHLPIGTKAGAERDVSNSAV